MKIDHIGIAVKSLAEALKLYEHAVGLQFAGYDQVDEQGVRVAMLSIGESRIELLEPTGPDSPVEKFMSRKITRMVNMSIRLTSGSSGTPDFLP